MALNPFKKISETGKSAATVLLGTERGAAVTVIDADPNKRVSRWASRPGKPKTLAGVADVSEDSIIDEIERAAQETAFVIVDLEGTASMMVGYAMSRADLVKQLHGDLLVYSEKDERHRGEYKTLRNDVAAFDADGKMLDSVFETETPFNTPRRKTELVAWLKNAREHGRLHPRRSQMPRISRSRHRRPNEEFSYHVSGRRKRQFRMSQGSPSASRSPFSISATTRRRNISSPIW